jgi:hypothetical protein
LQSCDRAALGAGTNILVTRRRAVYARLHMRITCDVERILEREVARPLPQELFNRIARRARVDLGEPAAELIKRERAARKVS